MTPPRPRQPSRPDMRADPDSTPPGGVDLSDELELARAGRERAPWWAELLLRKLATDEQFRRHGQRLGAVEQVTEAWEDQMSNTKITNREAEKARELKREKRIDRAWQVGAPLVVILILSVLGWVHFGPPAHPTPIEVKP